MKKLLVVVFITVTQGALVGCSINHPVAKDYPQFIVKNGAVSTLPKTSLETNYAIDSKTESHRYEFRAATVGYAHLWIVEFGKILDETLKASYVQSSFGRLSRVHGDASQSDHLLEFALEQYEFKNYRAYVTMRVVLRDGNQHVVLSKAYSAEGDAKGGQMWTAGPFGMKNATLDSTKSAIDKILVQLINDIPKSFDVAR